MIRSWLFRKFCYTTFDTPNTRNILNLLNAPYLIFQACLLVSANAAPAERSRRNILPGDPRYDPTGHHHHHEAHEHHENEIETSKALQSDFGGSFPVPDTSYGVVGSTTGAPLGFSDYFKYNFGTGLSGFSPEIVNIGGAKVTIMIQT